MKLEMKEDLQLCLRRKAGADAETGLPLSELLRFGLPYWQTWLKIRFREMYRERKRKRGRERERGLGLREENGNGRVGLIDNKREEGPYKSRDKMW